MEQSKKIVPRWAGVFLLVLGVAALALNILDLTKKFGPIFNVSYCMEIISILLMGFYCITGYKKSSARYFKGVLFARIISAALGLYIVSMYSQIFAVICSVVSLMCLLTLAFVKDLGKGFSMCLSILIIVASSTNFAYYTGLTGSVNACHATAVLLSVILLLMILAKYADKAARGSK